MLNRYFRLLMITMVASGFLPIVVVIGSRIFRKNQLQWTTGFTLLLVAMGIAAVVFAILLPMVFRALKQSLERISETQAVYIDNLSDSMVDIAIVVAAALSLFLELSVIRWLGSVYPVFAFYKNFSLLACFAGLGLGYAMAKDRHIPLMMTVPVFCWLALLLVSMRYGMGDWNITSVTKFGLLTEQLNMGLGKANWLMLVPLHMFLAVNFLLCVFTFIPVGQLCGRLMERRAKLHAYGLNLCGSILGVVLIFLVSFLWAPPSIWFAVAFLLLFPFQNFTKEVSLTAFCSIMIGITILSWTVSPTVHKIYSPYQLIERTADKSGLLKILAAGHYYQRVHDLDEDNSNRRTNKHLKSVADYYEIPYRLHGAPAKVAIVGSGTGNDVAAALRMGALRVDAIEIDPAIASLGKAYHPEKPYNDTRVRTVVNDARTFFRTTGDKYDLIVYGLLDSHTLLSHASSVRLDSFVYTVEGLQEARKCLKEGGTLVLSFSLISKEIGRKIHLMLTKAFNGQPPICIKAGYDGAVVFFQRKGGGAQIPSGLLEQTGFFNVTDLYADETIDADVSTDDWPFFYMPRRAFPVSFLPMAIMVMVLSWMVSRISTTHTVKMESGAFFLLGAGFMLVETKAITELGLTFGNTWQVIGIAIVGILTMAFLANLAVARFGYIKLVIPYLLLLVSLGLGLFIAKSGGFPPTPWGRIASAALLTCPIFFSGIIFSSLLRRGGDISGIMAANLLGAMFGGLLEYNSMYFGFGFLYLLAMVLYVTASFFGVKIPKQT